MSASSRASRLGLLQVCAAGVLWGTGGLAVTFLHQRTGMGAMTVSAWRMVLAAVALLGFAAITGRLRLVRNTFRARPIGAIVVGCGTAAYQGLYFVAVLQVGVSISTVVSLGLAPVLAATWEHLAAGTRPTLRDVAVLAAALGGLVLVTTATSAPSTPGASPVLGLVLSAAAGAVYAATTVLGRRLAQGAGPVALTTCTTTVGAVVLIPFAVVAAIMGEPVLTADPASIATLVYLGVATMALAYGLLYAGLRHTTGSAATVATLLEPVTAALLAALLLNERLPPTALIGGALILLAVVGLGHGRSAPVMPDRKNRR
jgi:drug/metabolite transporter, DME family